MTITPENNYTRNLQSEAGIASIMLIAEYEAHTAVFTEHALNERINTLEKRPRSKLMCDDGQLVTR